MPPTRGVVLISLDTLRADRLGAYGGERDTSPFFDVLAAQGTLFEHVAAPYPATLVSHMSMFTGLYPPQHGVYPPANVLPPGVWTLAEALQAVGYRTAAFTEGGFVAGGYGFARGFEIYEDTAYEGDGDIEATLARGLDFLADLGTEDRFFLFLHSYSIHDPYDPPAHFTPVFDASGPAPDSSGERLRDFNSGRIEIGEDEVERFSRRYDDSILYADGVLEHFVAGLRELGLLEETTLVITSDHGEEFMEHGKLAHTQLYPESLAVPLLIVHPHQAQGRRVSDQANLVDLAPTIAELAAAPAPQLAGRSLVPFLAGLEAEKGRLSFAELNESRYLRTLIGAVDGTRYQFLVEGARPDDEGTWVGESIGFDVVGSGLAFRSRSFHRSRNVTVLADGELVSRFEVTPEWEDFALQLPGSGVQRIELETDGCLRPMDVEASGDDRCLGVIVEGTPLMIARLFDLDRDPAARVDVSRDHPLVMRRLMRELQALRMLPVADAEVRPLSEDQRDTLRDLGYLD